jgi:DNA-binding transcriptional regulator YbjK
MPVKTRKTPGRAAPRTIRPRGAARREALLEATLQIVADTGADAVTHRRVAEVAQLPLASTTYYFESKEQLLTAALEVAAERDLARLRELADRRRGLPADPEHAGAVGMGSAGEPTDDDPAAGRRSLLASYTLLLEAARRPALQELTRRWTDGYLTVVADLLGRAGSARPAPDAQLLLAAADGLLISHLSTGEPTDPRPALLRLARTLTASAQ